MLELLRVPFARLRSWRAIVAVCMWSAVALASALMARRSSLPTGADHVLAGSFAVVVLPLLVFGLSSALVGGRGLRDELRGLVALGASPTDSARASVLVSVAVSALSGGMLAALVCAVAHGKADAPLHVDLAASFGVAFLGGAAYASYFAVGSALGRGGARGLLLAVDYVVGLIGGAGAWLTPRAHVVQLLGGHVGLDLARRTSFAVLVALGFVYFALAVRLARRVRG